MIFIRIALITLTTLAGSAERDWIVPLPVVQSLAEQRNEART
jgi:hypothetical protein